MSKKLRLLGPRLVVSPLPMPKPSTAVDLILVPKYFDDAKRWHVLQVGPGVDEIRPGDNVLTHGNEEPLHEFSDKVRIIRAKDVVMLWK